MVGTYVLIDSLDNRSLRKTGSSFSLRHLQIGL